MQVVQMWSQYYFHFFYLLHTHFKIFFFLFFLNSTYARKEEDLSVSHPHSQSSHWKEQCYEDFAVLSQFCAKIITLRL